jgi:tetratricopeptide (TPR) repeat protein
MENKLTIFLFLGIFLLAGTASFAQQDAFQRFSSELERTDQVLQKAREAVVESGSERAKNLLLIGLKLQYTAKRFAHDFTPMTMDQGLKYTISAREKAQRAIAITRQADENEAFVTRRLEKTNDMIRQVDARMGGDTPANIRLMLDSAREKQKRAMEFLRNGRLKAALQMTMQAEKTLHKIVEMISGFANTQKKYQVLTDRYYGLKERLDFQSYESQSGIPDQLAKAEILRGEAESLVLENEYGKAAKAMQKSVEILSRIAEKVREPAKIETALANLNRKVEKIKEKVNTLGDEPASKLYSDIIEHLSKGSSLFIMGNYDAAAAQIQAARQLLSKLSLRLGE